MRTTILATLVTGTLLFALAPAQAGTPTPATPVGMGCLLEETDSCTNTGFTSPAGLYAFGVNGYFQGTISATVSSGSIARTITCSGTLVGGVMFPGGCFQSGSFPPAGVPITLTCATQGSGVATCSVEGA